MKTLIKILITVFFTANICAYGFTDDWNSTSKIGTFNANILCNPQFTIDDPPGTPVNIGSFFIPNEPEGYKDHLITLPNVITWRLIGPKYKLPSQYIDYAIAQVEPNNTIDDGTSLTVEWEIKSQNYNYPHFTGQLNIGNIHLGNRLTVGGCGDGEAYFKIKAIRLTINNDAEVGVKTFRTTLKMTCNI